MKRALAERAKQATTTTNGGHHLEAPVAPVAPTSPDEEPPQKIPRVEKTSTAPPTSIAVPSTTATATRTSSGGNTPPAARNNNNNGGIRGRRPSNNASSSSLNKQQQQDQDESSAFYLKHQNSALASELRQLQYQFGLLEKERDFRRQQCSFANQAIHQLQATWTKMEAALGESRGNSDSSQTPAAATTTAAPQSTGTGDNVEQIGALLDSLSKLGTTAACEEKDNELERISQGISQRAQVLQEWIWKLLSGNHDDLQPADSLSAADLQGQISLLQSRIQDAESQIAELSKSRDEALQSDKKVRRGLYRLAAGRMKLQQVLKAVEDDSSDDNDKGMAALAALEEAPVLPSSDKTTTAAATENGGNGDEPAVVDSAQVDRLKKQLQDLEQVAKSREEQITKLTKEREDNLKRINELIVLKESAAALEQKKEISDNDVKQSGLYTETWTKMTTSERQLGEVQTRLEETKKKWADARGDAETALKTLEEHLAKHQKKWLELTGAQDGNVPDEGLEQQRQIGELQHKLKQSLENVRQADAIRTSLEESTDMNDALQAKLDELKVKNAALKETAAREPAAAKEASSKAAESPATPVDKSKAEKLHREHRKMRKELAAALASKENAKAKQERAEKELHSLMKSNARLLRQSAEKDDMNAKSLSTILHLKELTEKLSNDKELIEQQVKSAEQLQLANRLATNARDRVMEEVAKERGTLEARIEQLNQECESLKQAKETADGLLAKKQAEMATLETGVAKSRERCDELVVESTKQEEEKKRLLEELAVAKRESAEAAKKYATLRTQSGDVGTSEFTTEQLTTQVSVLKNRLACDVCHARDKKCMIVRCRHMFCKQCVEENIKNRSRKCPACGQRFDNKDVMDIWI